MRKGNKSKALIAVLALALALNMFPAAFAAGPVLETELEFEPAVDESEILAPEIGEPEIDLPEEEAVAELSADGVASVMAVGDEEGVSIQPGMLFQYGDRYFRVNNSATNIFNGGGANGGFDSKAVINGESSNQDVLYSNTAVWDATEGHDAPGCLAWSTGQVIWRHTFDTNKYYVMSAWYKFEGNINLNDGQRHLAGANDVETDSVHSNEIGRNRSITGGWQQEFFVFNGIRQSNGQFMYVQVVDNGGTLYLDDVVIYEVEEIKAQLTINGHTLESESGDSYNVAAGETIPAPGTYYHLIRYENELPNEYLLTGVVVLNKDDKLEKIFTVNTKTGRGTFSDTGMVAASGTVDIMFEIPEDEDVSHYSYTAFLTDRDKPFAILGTPRTTAGAGEAINPMFVYGGDKKQNASSVTAKPGEYTSGSIYVNIDSSSVVGSDITVSGEWSDANDGVVISAIMTKPGVKPSYTDDNIIAASLAAQNPSGEPVVWRDGTFTSVVTVPDDVPTGEYWIHVGSSATGEYTHEAVSYLSYNDRNELMAVYNSDSANAEKLMEQLDSMSQPLTVNAMDANGSAYGKLSSGGKLRFAELLLSLGESYKEEQLEEGIVIEELSFENLAKISRKALLLAAIDSSAEDEYGYENALNIFKEYAVELLHLNPNSNSGFTKVFNADNFIKALKAQHPESFSTTEEVEEVIDDALVLAVLNETSHLAYLDYIKSNNDSFQIDEDELQNASRNTKVAGYYGERIRAELPVYSYEDFAAAWERASKKAEKDYDNSKKGSGSSGGSGGGSSSGSKGGSSGTISKQVVYNPGLIGPDLVGRDPLGKNLTIYDYYDDIYGYEWAFGAIVTLTDEGVISGTGNKKFEPGRTLKREEFMKLLVNAFNLADIRATSSFTDVDEDAWYYMYIASAEQAGITSGRGDGTFGIGDDVTREEMATLVYRAAQKAGLHLATTGGNVNMSLYSDLDTLSPYALEAVSMLAVNGIMAGETGNLYAPKKGASRAQAALVIYNAKNFK
ncbi:MAG: S-layer homology domain-containing protein [Oscillospiraceae bacterium]|nr:S-layer homology domain-containing protein [Oscillospiraceae bacterium]